MESSHILSGIIPLKLLLDILILIIESNIPIEFGIGPSNSLSFNNNLSNFINREADKVLEDARKISDPQKRHDKYVHFQNILNQSLVAIFLYTPSYTYPVSDKIKGIETKNIITPSDRFSNIRNWFVKTKRAL